jgi:hypothetical protein
MPLHTPVTNRSMQCTITHELPMYAMNYPCLQTKVRHNMSAIEFT